MLQVICCSRSVSLKYIPGTCSTCSIWERKANNTKLAVRYISTAICTKRWVFCFRIRGQGPHSKKNIYPHMDERNSTGLVNMCRIEGNRRIRFLAFERKLFSNILFLYQQRTSFFHAFSFSNYSWFFAIGTGTLHILFFVWWQTINPRPVNRFLLLFLAIKQWTTYFESCSIWELLKFGN